MILMTFLYELPPWSNRLSTAIPSTRFRFIYVRLLCCLWLKHRQGKSLELLCQDIEKTVWYIVDYVTRDAELNNPKMEMEFPRYKN